MLTSTFVFALDLVRKQEDIDTLGPAYKEFGSSEYSAIIMIRCKGVDFFTSTLLPAMLKVFLQRALAFNEQFLLYHFTCCKRDPV